MPKQKSTAKSVTLLRSTVDLQAPRHAPTMLVILMRDDAIRRNSIASLNDLKALGPEEVAFNLFLVDVAAALHRELRPGLAEQVRRLLIGDD